MARIFPSEIIKRPEGRLLIEETGLGCSQLYFVPHEKALTLAKLNATDPERYKKLTLDIDETKNYITIYPLNTLATDND